MKNLIITLLIILSAWAGPAGAGEQKLKLMLDWFPNVDHLPVFVARDKGYFAENGIRVDIISPSETSDALKLAASGHVDLAVSYQPQTIMAADQGIAVKVVAPLVTHPLTTLLFLKGRGIETPADLSGQKIGYTVPGLMDILLDAFAGLNGIQDFTPVNVGFTILPALASNQVAAVMGPFKTYETVTMAGHGYEAGFFELEKYGIPDYEELIFVCGKNALKEKPQAIKGFVAALEKALAHTATRPDDALAVYLKAVPEADPAIETRAFELTRPYFATRISHDPARWQAFADFALDRGLIQNKVDGAALIHIWK